MDLNGETFGGNVVNASRRIIDARATAEAGAPAKHVLRLKLALIEWDGASSAVGRVM